MRKQRLFNIRESSNKTYTKTLLVGKEEDKWQKCTITEMQMRVI